MAKKKDKANKVEVVETVQEPVLEEAIKVEEPKKEEPKVERNSYGSLKVLADSIEVYEKADFNSRILKRIKKGKELEVHAVKNGLLKLGENQYCTSDSESVLFNKN